MHITHTNTLTHTNLHTNLHIHTYSQLQNQNNKIRNFLQQETKIKLKIE